MNIVSLPQGGGATVHNLDGHLPRPVSFLCIKTCTHVTVYQPPVTAITNTRRLAGLKHQKCVQYQFHKAKIRVPAEPCSPWKVPVAFLSSMLHHSSLWPLCLPLFCVYQISLCLHLTRTPVMGHGAHLDNPGSAPISWCLTEICKESFFPNKATFAGSRD